jgi:hypothetical protein
MKSECNRDYFESPQFGWWLLVIGGLSLNWVSSTRTVYPVIAWVDSVVGDCLQGRTVSLRLCTSSWPSSEVPWKKTFSTSAARVSYSNSKSRATRRPLSPLVSVSFVIFCYKTSDHCQRLQVDLSIAIILTLRSYREVTEWSLQVLAFAIWTTRASVLPR